MVAKKKIQTNKQYTTHTKHTLAVTILAKCTDRIIVFSNNMMSSF